MKEKFLILLMCSGPLYSSLSDAQRALQTPPASLPQMITEHPSEISLQEEGALDQAASQAFQTEGGKYMAESLEKRPYFRINPQTDPMITFSDQIHSHKEDLIAGKAITVSVPQFKNIHYCLEGKATFEVTSIESLQEGRYRQKKKTYLGTRHHGWSNTYWSSWRYNEPQETTRVVFRHFDGCNWWDHHIEQHNLFEIRTHHFDINSGHFMDEGWQAVDQRSYDAFNSQEDEKEDRWVSSHPLLAEKVKKGFCMIKEKKCISQVNSKTFAHEQEPLTFSRPCFQWQVTYTCQGSSKQECTPLRQKGCVQTHSRCEKVLSGECYEWRQKLRCPTGVLVKHQIQASIPGHWQVSQELTSAPNTEMGEVLATLSLFDEMKKDTGALNPQVFKGGVNRCTKAFASFKDCCGKQGGWGVDLNLSGCNGEDQALAQKRAKGLCVEVGTFCVEKALGVCLRKKTSFCCFDSKMSRIFHEQGRRQLGLGFGDGENPHCRGFSIEELQRIDFSKIDLSEIHEDILKNIKIPNAPSMTQGLQDRLTHMTQSAQNTAPQGGL